VFQGFVLPTCVILVAFVREGLCPDGHWVEHYICEPRENPRTRKCGEHREKVVHLSPRKIHSDGDRIGTFHSRQCPYNRKGAQHSLAVAQTFPCLEIQHHFVEFGDFRDERQHVDK